MWSEFFDSRRVGRVFEAHRFDFDQANWWVSSKPSTHPTGLALVLLDGLESPGVADAALCGPQIESDERMI